MDINVYAKFCHCLFKILKNQNVADRRTDVKTVYPPPTHTQTEFAGGGGYNKTIASTSIK